MKQEDADLRDYEEKYWERQFAKQDAEWKRLNIRGPAPLNWVQRLLAASLVVIVSLEVAYHFAHYLVRR